MFDMRNNIIPLLEQYGVDLVLGGHSHIYERSKFIKGHYGLETTFNNSLFPTGNVVQTSTNSYTKSTLRGNGTIYVVCGVSGSSGGSTQTGYPHNAMQVSTTSNNGSLILDINGGVLSCKFLTTSGSIYDQFTITKNTRLLREENPETIDEVKENKNIVTDKMYYDINGNFISNDYNDLPKNQIIIFFYREGTEVKTKKIVKVE
jgi:hypothetical protein